MEHFLEVVEHLCAHTDTFMERRCTDRTDHEFLEADGSVRVSATVDDVHHRNGENVSVATTYIFVEGKVEVVGCSLCNCERYAEDSVGAEVALGVGAVESQHGLVDSDLIKGIHANESCSDRTVYIGYGLCNALAHIAAFVTVAKLKSLVFTCRCARRNGCASKSTAFEQYVYFYCGIAAGVKYLTTCDFCDFHNFCLLNSLLLYVLDLFFVLCSFTSANLRNFSVFQYFVV